MHCRQALPCREKEGDGHHAHSTLARRGQPIVGVWLVLSPFSLGFAGAAFWIPIVLGLCVILFSVEGFVIPSYLEEWGELLIGLALVVVPWTVG